MAPDKWEDRDMLVIKYIDDFNSVEKVFKNNATMTISQRKTVQALKSKILYDLVRKSGGEIRIKLNAKKTQMLCIVPRGEKETTPFIKAPEGEVTKSGNRLKILGFYFGRTPDVSEHVDSIIKKKLFTPLDLSLIHI